MSGPSPSFSRTPGRKGSITISACGIKDFNKSIPKLDLRSTAIEDFRLVRGSFVGGLSSVDRALGTARSIRRTEAPLSAKSRPANGPALC